MERRDLLKDQIEQLGKVLAKILSDLIGFKAKGQVIEGIQITTQQLRESLDIDLEKLSGLNKEELKDYMQKRQLISVHFEVLSEYLEELGRAEMDINKEKAIRWLEKSVELLDLSDEISKTASFEQFHRKKNLQALIENYQ